MPQPVQPAEFESAVEFTAPLAAQPLRTPAPAVTKIRVTPEPVDGFEFERANLWADEPKPETDDEPDTAEATVPVPRLPATPRAPKAEKRTLSWLDEDERA